MNPQISTLFAAPNVLWSTRATRTVLLPLIQIESCPKELSGGPRKSSGSPGDAGRSIRTPPECASGLPILGTQLYSAGVTVVVPGASPSTRRSAHCAYSTRTFRSRCFRRGSTDAAHFLHERNNYVALQPNKRLKLAARVD